MRFLQLAASDLFRKPGEPFVMPCRVYIGLAPAPRAVVEEGVAHGYMGGPVSIRALLEPWGLRALGNAHGEWLLPFVERMDAGEAVTEDELVRAFRARHRRDPEVLDWDLP